jgi:hypothetical protein
METLTTLLGNTKPWGDMLYEDEQNRKLAILRMPEPEWFACVNAYFNTLRGNGRALLSALSWFTRMEAERVAFQASPTAPVVEETTRDWRVWQDMVEEPEKYGSDIGEWLELDEELRRGPKRWRVNAYWYDIVRAIEVEEQTAAATKVQALWRGYQTRSELAPRFNCARCLSHKVCWVAWEDRTEWLCEPCAHEWSAALRALGEQLEVEEELAELEARLEEDREQGLEDEVCADCGEDIVMYAAKVGGEWFCAACIHDWTECDRCTRVVRLGDRCDNHCKECGDELTGLGTTNDFCSGDCHYSYMRDC